MRRILAVFFGCSVVMLGHGLHGGGGHAEAQAPTCERVTDFAQCAGDLSCSFNIAKRTCHTRSNLPKCEAVPDYLCMGRNDCMKTLPTASDPGRCMGTPHHQKFDETPHAAIAAQPVCAAIKNVDDCYRNFWCQYYNDGKTQKCITRHMPIAEAAVTRPKSAKSKDAVKSANSCPQGGLHIPEHRQERARLSYQVGGDAHRSRSAAG